jgi:hypothetical protein
MVSSLPFLLCLLLFFFVLILIANKRAGVNKPSGRISQQSPPDVVVLNPAPGWAIQESQHIEGEASLSNFEGASPGLDKTFHLESETAFNNSNFEIDRWEWAGFPYLEYDFGTAKDEAIGDQYSGWEYQNPGFGTHQTGIVNLPDTRYGMNDLSSEAGNTRVIDPGYSSFHTGHTSEKARPMAGSPPNRMPSYAETE